MAAGDVNSLARQEPIKRVGELDLRHQGLLTDTYLFLATKPKAEWPWSPKQSFTAGVQPDGNVCRAEFNKCKSRRRDVPKRLKSHQS